MHMKQITKKRIKSPMPAYTAAACIIVFGLIFPLYRVYGIVLVAVIDNEIVLRGQKAKDRPIITDRTYIYKRNSFR